LQSPLEGHAIPQRHRANKGSICRENAPSLLKASLLFEHGRRLVEASAWKVCSANYFLTRSERQGDTHS
jgi:hypothetical protein